MDVDDVLRVGILTILWEIQKANLFFFILFFFFIFFTFELLHCFFETYFVINLLLCNGDTEGTIAFHESKLG